MTSAAGEGLHASGRFSMSTYLDSAPVDVDPAHDSYYLGRAAAGCVSDHRKLRRSPRVALYPGGCQAKAWRGSTVHMPPAQKRGVCRGFTSGAAQRLRLRLCTVEWGVVDVGFAVLTYPNRHPIDWHEYKADLNAILRRIERTWPGCLGAFWRLEFQQRGAAHYNLLLFWPRGKRPPEAVWRAALAFDWLSVIGALDDPDARKYGVRGFEGERYEDGGLTRLLAYVGGEMSKRKQSKQVDRETGESLQTGRCWGVRNFAGRGIPMAELGTIELSEADWEAFCQRVNKRGGKKPGGSWYLRAIDPEWAGFTVFADPDSLLELLGLGVLVTGPGEKPGDSQPCGKRPA